MRFLLLAVSVLSVSCASIHSGKYAEESSGPSKKLAPNASGLIVSGSENRRLASEYFGSFDFTFENTSDKWVRVKDVTIDFGDASVNDKVVVVVGKDLVAWSEAAQQQAAISDYNTSLVLGSVAVAGLAAANYSGDSGVRTGGAFAAIGAGTALTVNSIRRDLSDLERAKLVPSTHLYSSDFIVPPKLHTKKWVTVYTVDPVAVPYFQRIVIRYKTESGQTESATIPFRNLGTASEWQRNHPEVKAFRKSQTAGY